MNNSGTYEKIVKVKNRGKHLAKKISVILAYALFFSIWLISAVNTPKKIVPIIVAGILATLLLVILTWKYLQVEYEYSFWYGNMSIAKIYAKRKRKAIIETEIKDLLLIAPATDEYILRAEHFEIEERVIAVSSENADDIWLAVTGGKDERRVLIFFEADERSLAMLRAANSHVFVKKP